MSPEELTRDVRAELGLMAETVEEVTRLVEDVHERSPNEMETGLEQLEDVFQHVRRAVLRYLNSLSQLE